MTSASTNASGLPGHSAAREMTGGDTEDRLPSGALSMAQSQSVTRCPVICTGLMPRSVAAASVLRCDGRD